MKKNFLLLIVILTFNLSIFIPASFAQFSDWLWAKSALGYGMDFTKHVTTDKSGNVILVGSIGSYTLVFDTITLNNLGQSDIFIVKYDSVGHVLWAKSANGTSWDFVTCVHTDESENIYIAGYFFSPTLFFNTTTLNNTGTGDMFVAKYDAVGNLIWAINNGATVGVTSAQTVTTDASGNVFVSGKYNSPTLTFDTTTLINSDASGSSWDLFLVKYDVFGNVQWAKTAIGTWHDGVECATTDISGNVLIAGYSYSSSLTFDTTVVNFDDISSLFLAKYDSDGYFLWVKSAAGSESNEIEQPLSIITDDLDNIYLTGSFRFDTITFDNIKLINTEAGTDDIFIAKFDSNGNVLWAKSAGGAGIDMATSISLDAFGDLFVTGFFSSLSLTVGNTTMINVDASNPDILLIKYDTAGHVLWAKSAGGMEYYKPESGTTDAFGNAYVSGYFYGYTITFGSTVLTNHGNYNVFLAKLNGVATDISERSFTASRYNIYPNPTTNYLIIENPSPTKKTFILSLMNIQGQLLFSEYVEIEKTHTIDLSKFPNSIYFLSLQNEKDSYVSKVVVQR